MRINLRIHFWCVLFGSVAVGQASGLKTEKLSDFTARLYKEKSPISGVSFGSWNVGNPPLLYVGFPSPLEMKKATNSYPVSIFTPGSEVAITFAVFDTKTMKDKKLDNCEKLGNNLWGSQCEKKKKSCSFHSRHEFNFDGLSYVRYRTLMTLENGPLPVQSIYQCSIGKEFTISIAGFFIKPFGAFRTIEDLETAMSHILISKSAELKIK